MPHRHDSPHGQMPTTHWTLIAQLQSQVEAERQRALDDLCQAYHYPLYCHIRRRGLDHHDAEDVLHDFLSKLLRNDSFGIADPDKGRLRTFLLTALQRFLNTWHRDQSRRQNKEISADAEAAIASAEGRYQKEMGSHNESPDQLYDRQWAKELMRLVMQRLRKSYTAKGKEALFDTLSPVLTTGGSLADHDTEQLAASLAIRPGTLRVALMRLLRDYQEALRRELLQTVEGEEQAKAEFAVLVTAFEMR